MNTQTWDIVKMYDEGKSLTSIVQHTGLSITTVNQIALKYCPGRNKAIREMESQSIRVLWAQKLPITEIANKLKIKRARVNYIVKSYLTP